jgi:hypothetical protein
MSVVYIGTFSYKLKRALNQAGNSFATSCQGFIKLSCQKKPLSLPHEATASLN